MVRPTEKYIKPIDADIKDMARALFGKDTKKLLEEEKQLQEELVRLKKLAKDNEYTEIEQILSEVTLAIKNDRKRMGRLSEALKKEGW